MRDELDQHNGKFDSVHLFMSAQVIDFYLVKYDVQQVTAIIIVLSRNRYDNNRRCRVL
jgi:hypothetical protein